MILSLKLLSKKYPCAANEVLVHLLKFASLKTWYVQLKYGFISHFNRTSLWTPFFNANNLIKPPVVTLPEDIQSICPFVLFTLSFDAVPQLKIKISLQKNI